MTEKPASHQDGDVFTVTEIGPSRFSFLQRSALTSPTGRVWATIRDFQQFVKIILPTATFAWVEGGSSHKVPSRYELRIGDSTLLEELTYRDEQERTIRYHLVSPGFGMQAYSSEMKLSARDGQQTVLEYKRDITLQPGASVETLKQVAQQEMVALKAFFTKGA